MQSVTIVAPKVLSGISNVLAAVGAYTPASGALVTMIAIANKTANIIFVDATLYNGSTDYYLAQATPVGPNDTLFLGGENCKVTLVNGWNVRVRATVAGGVADAVMCVTEFA